MNVELKIDPEFERIIPPLTEDEFKQLEENILEEDRVTHSIAIWNGVIVDGHNRYKIVQKHPEIPFTTYEKYFSNRYEAITWICNNQLGRRNLNEAQKEAILGRKYQAEKKAYGASDGFRGNQNTTSVGCQNDNLPKGKKTIEKIAEKMGVSPSSVIRAEKFVKGIDAAEEAVPGTERKIMSGKIKPSKTDMMAIAKAPLEERPAMVQRLYEPKEKPPKREKNQAGTCNGVVIGDLVAELRRPKEPMTADKMIDSLKYAVVTMTKSCDKTFKQFPELLTDASYLDQVIAIMQEPKNYIINIERKKDENGSQN